MRPRVAVVTAYAGEPIEWLSACHASVRRQAIASSHIVVADGRPRSGVDGMCDTLVAIAGPHDDFGDAARAVGVKRAIDEGHEIVALLDADNWFLSTHLCEVVAAMEEQDASVGASRRWLCTVDGEVMDVCSQSGTSRFSDTSSVVFRAEAAAPWVDAAALPSWAHAIGDRIIWSQAVVDRPPALTDSPTSCYRCRHGSFYRHIGVSVPDTVPVRSNGAIRTAVERWRRERGEDLAL